MARDVSPVAMFFTMTGAGERKLFCIYFLFMSSKTILMGVIADCHDLHGESVGHKMRLDTWLFD